VISIVCQCKKKDKTFTGSSECDLCDGKGFIFFKDEELIKLAKGRAETIENREKILLRKINRVRNKISRTKIECIDNLNLSSEEKLGIKIAIYFWLNCDNFAQYIDRNGIYYLIGLMGNFEDRPEFFPNGKDKTIEKIKKLVTKRKRKEDN